ncbi:MAG: SDR family oxidoreductase [Pseudomonadota bacterium]
MAEGRMAGKRVVVTQVADYMGPAMVETFRREGAEVIADNRDLRGPGACEDLIRSAGEIDVLIANMAATEHLLMPAHETSDEMWEYMFDMMVHPLHRLCRTLLPRMYARQAGKIVVVGSVTGIRIEKAIAASAYAAARSAQVGYVRAVGAEAARNNVQINLIAQHFTYSETFFPESMQQREEFREWIKTCPAGRLATGEEDGELALFLASDKCNFVTGTAIPFAGGWHL